MNKIYYIIAMITLVLQTYGFLLFLEIPQIVGFGLLTISYGFFMLLSGKEEQGK